MARTAFLKWHTEERWIICTDMNEFVFVSYCESLVGIQCEFNSAKSSGYCSVTSPCPSRHMFGTLLCQLVCDTHILFHIHEKCCLTTPYFYACYNRSEYMRNYSFFTIFYFVSSFYINTMPTDESEILALEFHSRPGVLNQVYFVAFIVG